MAPSIATTSISTKMEKKKKEGGAVVAVVDEKKTEVAVVSKLDRAQVGLFTILLPFRTLKGGIPMFENWDADGLYCCFLYRY